MDKTGLINNIIKSVTDIYMGRQWLDTDGQEREGRISYNIGLSLATETFQHVQSIVAEDLELTVLAEYTFLAQELDVCDPLDVPAISSLKSAIQSVDDAFLSLDAVENAELYYGAEMTHPHSSKYRIKGMPRDAFHIMCISHRARINNALRTPGINLTEKGLFAQRLANINSAQAAYLEKQRQIMADVEKQFGIEALPYGK